MCYFFLMAKDYDSTTPLALALFSITVLIILVAFPNLLALSLTEWLLVLGGTFGIARIVAREKVFLPVREISYKIGIDEIITCSRCIGVWSALFLALGVSLIGSPFLFLPALFTIAGINIVFQEIMGILSKISHFFDLQNSNLAREEETKK
jgi:hypothetical protein